MAVSISFFSIVCVSCISTVEEPSVDIVGLKKMMNLGHEYVLLDVRTPEETAEGKINGAIEADVKSDDFKDQIDKLDKEQSYIIYCRSGKRSSKAYKIMKENGFGALMVLDGGYLAYSAEK